MNNVVAICYPLRKIIARRVAIDSRGQTCPGSPLFLRVFVRRVKGSARYAENHESIA